jgi:hypothetical protein
MKSSCHGLIPFLPLFCNYQFRRLDSVQFLCSQANIPAGWSLQTRLISPNHISWQTGIPKLDSVPIPLLPSSYSGKLASRNSTHFLSTKLYFITTLHGSRRKHSHSVVEKACFTAPLHSNESYSIDACVCVAAGMCLRSRCLAMDVCSSFTVLAFGLHVTNI